MQTVTGLTAYCKPTDLKILATNMDCVHCYLFSVIDDIAALQISLVISNVDLIIFGADPYESRWSDQKCIGNKRGTGRGLERVDDV